MKSPKLETLNESWAFYGSHKAFPIRAAEINNGELYDIDWNYDDYEIWLEDYRELGENTPQSTSRHEWLEYHGDIPIRGYGGGNAKKLWQLSVNLQNQVYSIARKHSYCQSPASRDWAHPPEVSA